MNVRQIRSQLANAVQAANDALSGFDAVFGGAVAVETMGAHSSTAPVTAKRGRKPGVKKAAKAAKVSAKKSAKAKSAIPHPASRVKSEQTKATGAKRGRPAAQTQGEAAAIEAAIVGALRNAGEGLGRAALLQAAGIGDRDSNRATNAINRLKTDGEIVMSGSRRGAVYALSTASKHSNGASPAPDVEIVQGDIAAEA